MEMQNITLSLPRETLLKVKLLAVRQGTSVSSLVKTELEKLAAQEDAYLQARQRHLRLLDEAMDLGTEGQIRTTRDGLHERP
jgi:hypothetical protein